jgi:choline-glycine betaine transporter
MRRQISSTLRKELGMEQLPWATLFAGLLLIIVAVIGGVVVIVEPKTLSFGDYSNDLSKLAVGIGLVAVGRGVTAAGKHIGKNE